MTRQRTVIIVVLVVLVLCGCCVVATGAGGALYLLSSSERLEGRLLSTAEITPIAPPSTRVAEPTAISPATATAEATARPTAPAERTQGGVLRLPGALPPTFDPALSGDSTSAQYIVEIFSGLVTVGPDLELVPDIAERYEVSEDGLTYTFHLRRGVQFHNGKPLTADDIRFSLERSCHPDTGSSVALTYLGDIVGAKEMLSGEADSLSGVSVVDDYTVQITIDAPKPSFLAKLSHPVAFAVDEESVSSADVITASNGTGPFRLTEVSYERIVLESNPDYYREPTPALDRVVFDLSAGDSVTMYETDELDAAPVGSDDLPRITDPANDTSDELTLSEQLSTFYIGLNCQVAPFDDPLVRQAFARAIDRQRIVDLLYDQTVPAADTIVPPQMPGYDNEGLSAPAYDPEEARALLAESSYHSAENLPEITLFISAAGPQTDSTADAIAYLIEDSLGVKISIRQADWSTFLDAIGDPDHQFQMYMLGWIADYPDAENFLNVLFNSESPDNHSRYSSEEVDRLLQEAAVDMDSASRNETYRKIEEIVLADCPVIPLYHDVEYWLTKPYVHDAYYPAMVVPRLQYIYMDR